MHDSNSKPIEIRPAARRLQIDPLLSPSETWTFVEPEEALVALLAWLPEAEHGDSVVIRFIEERQPERVKPERVKFPDIGCRHQHDGSDGCGFVSAGVGLQCRESEACGRYLHPGDAHHADVERFHLASLRGEA